MSVSKEICGCSIRDAGKEKLLIIHIKSCKNKHPQKIQVAGFTETEHMIGDYNISNKYFFLIVKKKMIR